MTFFYFFVYILLYIFLILAFPKIAKCFYSKQGKIIFFHALICCSFHWHHTETLFSFFQSNNSQVSTCITVLGACIFTYLYHNHHYYYYYSFYFYQIHFHMHFLMPYSLFGFSLPISIESNTAPSHHRISSS